METESRPDCTPRQMREHLLQAAPVRPTTFPNAILRASAISRFPGWLTLPRSNHLASQRSCAVSKSKRRCSTQVCKSQTVGGILGLINNRLRGYNLELRTAFAWSPHRLQILGSNVESVLLPLSDTRPLALTTLAIDADPTTTLRTIRPLPPHRPACARILLAF